VDAQNAWAGFVAETGVALKQELVNQIAQEFRRSGLTEYTVEGLVAAYYRLLAANANPRPKDEVAIAQPIQEIPEEDLPGFPKRVNQHESGWQYSQRVQNWREQRAQAAWRERENARLAATPPAASTIRNTRHEQIIRRTKFGQ
jgi:hypothetical protein